MTIPNLSTINSINSEIADYRRLRVDAAAAAVSRLDSTFTPAELNTPLPYSVLHHGLFQMIHGARETNQVEVDKGLGLVRTAALDGLNEARYSAHVSAAFVNKEECDRIDDADFMSPVYVVRLAAVDPTTRLVASEEFEEPLRLISDAGFRFLIEKCLGIVVILDPISPDQASDSYSLTALPCTVFMDLPNDHLRRAETLVHELAHSWFNEVIGALRINLPEEPTWYSVWRDQLRPAFGILHACLAFSAVVTFLARALNSEVDLGDPGERAWIRLQGERQRLRSMATPFRESIAYVDASMVSDLISELYDEATS